MRRVIAAQPTALEAIYLEALLNPDQWQYYHQHLLQTSPSDHLTANERQRLNELLYKFHWKKQLFLSIYSAVRRTWLTWFFSFIPAVCDTFPVFQNSCGVRLLLLNTNVLIIGKRKTSSGDVRTKTQYVSRSSSSSSSLKQLDSFLFSNHPD